jgi:hypothetical protein
MNPEMFLKIDHADLQQVGAIGPVDIVNGAGACVVPRFLPTQAEAVELARYWESTFLHRAYFVFSTGQIGSTDLRLLPYAERRAALLICLVGRDAAHAVQEVRDEFARNLGTRRWKKFCKYLGAHHIHGTT